MWFRWLLEEKLLYIASHCTSVNASNLQCQPYVVLCAGNADDTFVLQGLARLVIDAAEKECVNGLVFRGRLSYDVEIPICA